ncbi:amidohydrolase family protein [Kribbella turkmenica]|uniref:Amidohydrolase family protein n=1 Tax=Kribbella turkmenica TaxID=2530375 RepID=A0A4R4X8J6_9ACTN|nr:amidohydrolase family protein [Kribbella turkmenica]TDD26818.1 amidohydrolase family protein [Kribbella turkmenica]
MTSLWLLNARLLDGTGSDPVDGAWLRIAHDRIAEVGVGPVTVGSDPVIDCAGRTVMPGLIDCHVHLAAVDMIHLLDRHPKPVLAAQTFRNMTETLRSGFTSVRDAGFTDYGFRHAATAGLVPSPRLFLSTGPLSQTGGHSDFRPRDDHLPQRPTDGLVHLGHVVDGVDACRWAAREVLRRGADQIKVMAGGGCASPNDDVSHTQFTVEELEAVVYEARARQTYVMAHAYNPDAIKNCVKAGVRSIEHVNCVDESAAAAMAKAGTYAVPTIATYELLANDGTDQGMPADQVEKVRRVLADAYEGLKILLAHKVPIGSGSDVLGAHQSSKALELELKARVLGPMGALVASTRTNAQILGRAEDLGTLQPGRLADVLIVDGDPLTDITVLQERSRLHYVLLGGRIVSAADEISTPTPTRAES